MILRPLFLALSLAIAVPMTANAQTSPDIAIASPQGTLLSVSASADATRVPDVATISTGWSPRPRTPMRRCAPTPCRWTR